MAVLDHLILKVNERAESVRDSFHAVGNGKGPGVEGGSRGDAASVYFLDPNRHLIEMRHYE